MESMFILASFCGKIEKKIVCLLIITAYWVSVVDTDTVYLWNHIFNVDIYSPALSKLSFWLIPKFSWGGGCYYITIIHNYRHSQVTKVCQNKETFIVQSLPFLYHNIACKYIIGRIASRCHNTAFFNYTPTSYICICIVHITSVFSKWDSWIAK